MIETSPARPKLMASAKMKRISALRFLTFDLGFLTALGATLGGGARGFSGAAWRGGGGGAFFSFFGGAFALGRTVESASLLVLALVLCQVMTSSLVLVSG